MHWYTYLFIILAILSWIGFAGNAQAGRATMTFFGFACFLVWAGLAWLTA